MKQAGIFELVEEWKTELAAYQARAAEARDRHFEIHPDDHPERTATGDWMFWEDKATALGKRIEDLERAILATVPNGPVEIRPSPMPEGLDDARRLELEGIISTMSEIVSRFYFSAVGVRNHPFIEWTGILNEYIRMCEQALFEGVDFTACHIHASGGLPVSPMNTDYIAEKVICIFGNSVRNNRELFEDFMATVLEGER